MEHEALLVVRGVRKEEHIVQSVDFDLYFMNERLVAIHTFNPYYVERGSGFSRDFISPIIETGVEKLRGAVWSKEHASTDNLSLDEMVASDKKNFVLYYSDISSIELKESEWGSHCRLSSTKMQIDFEVPDEQFELLKTNLPRISGLSDKVQHPKV